MWLVPSELDCGPARGPVRICSRRGIGILVTVSERELSQGLLAESRSRSPSRILPDSLAVDRSSATGCLAYAASS